MVVREKKICLFGADVDVVYQESEEGFKELISVSGHDVRSVFPDDDSFERFCDGFITLL